MTLTFSNLPPALGATGPTAHEALARPVPAVEGAPRLVLYHANCPDGFGAALAAWLHLGTSAEYVPCQYNEPAPEVTGRHVYILDFSFDAQTLARMGEQAASLVLLDHHETAWRALAGVQLACPGCVRVDRSQAGAVLAWRHFHPTLPLPRLFRMLQARDLWAWDEPHAAEYLAWFDTLEHSFAGWAQVLGHSQAEHERAVREGAAMLTKMRSVYQSIARAAVPVHLAGEPGFIVNASPQFASEVGSLLAARGEGFGLVWSVQDPQWVHCSLRSIRGAGLDVQALAARFGGGGHVSAAGFRIPVARLPELLAGTLVP